MFDDFSGEMETHRRDQTYEIPKWTKA